MDETQPGSGRSVNAPWALRAAGAAVIVCGLLALWAPSMTWVWGHTGLDLAHEGELNLTPDWWGIRGWEGEFHALYIGAGFAYVFGAAMVIIGALTVALAGRATPHAGALAALVAVPLASLLLASGVDGHLYFADQGTGATLWLLSSLVGLVSAVAAVAVATGRHSGTSVPRHFMELAIVTLVAGVLVLGAQLPPDPIWEAPRLWPTSLGQVLVSLGLASVWVGVRCAAPARQRARLTSH